MKKFLASVLAAAAVVSSAFSLASCSSGEPGEKDLENVSGSYSLEYYRLFVYGDSSFCRNGKR